MVDPFFVALELVFQPYVLLVIVCAGAFGLLVGSIPGFPTTDATVGSLDRVAKSLLTGGKFRRRI